MDDLNLFDAVERYIRGEMSPDERVYFEQLRKNNPEVDGMVVEHTFFLQQMNRFDETRKLKHLLNDTHVQLAEKGLIQSPKLQGKAKLVYLFNRHKRTAMIAASIAGVTALMISALVWSVSPGKPISAVEKDLTDLKRGLNALDQKNAILSSKIDSIENQQSDTAAYRPPIQYTSGGTGFLIDGKGYVVTNSHVIDNARHIAVQGIDGRELEARVVYKDAQRDIAILKIVSSSFKTVSSLPYSIRKAKAELAEPIFTLGFPRNEIVYGEGYVAARTGYKGDSIDLQITIAANKGNSGGPVLNNQGEIVGIISRKQTDAEGAVFALHSKYIFDALNEMKKADPSYSLPKLPSQSPLRGKQRTQQVKSLSEFVYLVKVD